MIDFLTGRSEIELSYFREKTFDMFITSPPYDNLRDYDGYHFSFEGVAEELYRILKEGGIGVWVVNDQYINGSRSLTSFKQALYFQELGFRIHDVMIYEKNGASFPSTNRYYQVYEFMFILSKGKPKTTNLLKDRPNKWAGSTNFGTPTKRKKDGTLIKKEKYIVPDYGIRYNIWKINGGYGYSAENDIAYNHPAIFPLSLAEDHIKSWSNENDLILDPMCGSGTTAIACAKLNRSAVCIDMNPSYIKLAKERYEEFINDVD